MPKSELEAEASYLSPGSGQISAQLNLSTFIAHRRSIKFATLSETLGLSLQVLLNSGFSRLFGKH